MRDIFDFIFDRPIVFFGLIGAVVVGFCYLAIRDENRGLEHFRQRCLIAGETPAKCALMVETKETADSAAFAAGMALGYSAGRR